MYEYTNELFYKLPLSDAKSNWNCVSLIINKINLNSCLPQWKILSHNKIEGAQKKKMHRDYSPWLWGDCCCSWSRAVTAQVPEAVEVAAAEPGRWTVGGQRWRRRASLELPRHCRRRRQRCSPRPRCPGLRPPSPGNNQRTSIRRPSHGRRDDWGSKKKNRDGCRRRDDDDGVMTYLCIQVCVRRYLPLDVLAISIRQVRMRELYNIKRLYGFCLHFFRILTLPECNINLLDKF